MNGWSSWGVQSGASYQYSPLSTSILPSLFTSATATPSDRNVRSRTVFFQVIWEGATGLSAEAAGAATTAAAAAATSAGNTRYMRGSSGWDEGELSGGVPGLATR